MRGKVYPICENVIFSRITPAYAGKSISCSVYAFCVRDHPRLCGEKGMEKKLHICFMGSPPPMRGKVHSVTLYRDHVGITPAYAGKSGALFTAYKFEKDHPRLCGEKSYETSRFLWQIGSPPPMRGKVQLEIVVYKLCGITPAYAGKSQSALARFSQFQDHPRLCGEKTMRISIILAKMGSPPPMRGKVRTV